MSQRRARRGAAARPASGEARAGSVPAGARLVFGALVGGLLGAAAAPRVGASFVEPALLDADRWNVISPALDANVVGLAGRGTMVAGGEIVLVPHVFHRADVVTPRAPQALGEAQLTLAPGSGPLSVRLRDGGRMLALELTPDAWRATPGVWRPHAGPYAVRVSEGVARLDDVVLGRAAAPLLELSVGGEVARITSLRLSGPDGAAWITEDPAAAWQATAPWAEFAAFGVLLGAAAATGPGAALAALVPVAVTLVPQQAWLGLVERLYLARAAPWELARAALGIALLPVLVSVFARARGAALPLGELDRRGVGVWVAAAVLVAIPASRGLADAELLLVPLGVAALLAPLPFLRAAGLDPVGALVRDLPAQLAVAAIGWGGGLLVAVAWRLVVLVVSAGVLVRRSPRVAADAVFLCTLALLPAAELATRSTWLDTAWDAGRLSGAAAFADPTLFWEAQCGAPPRTVLYMGGSSTGGAYQFQGDPGAFYPARTHARLCAAGLAVASLNYGDSGRDSYTFARVVDTLLEARPPAVIVAYFGVNDLLTQESPYTRAEQAARAESATEGLLAVATRSRLFTGLALLARPAQDATSAAVAAVPLPDAEVNLRRIAAAARRVGATLLLVPEHAEPDTAARIVGYAALERRLAGELPGVRFVDTTAGLAPHAAEELLVDRNHLSRHGSDRLAELLEPALADLLGSRAEP